MKRVSFITIHFGSNFGSILQTIATSEVLKSLNNDVTCINYIQNRWTLKQYFSVSNPLRLIKRIIFSPVELANRYIYQNFLKKYVKLSKAIYRNDNFIKKCPNSDYYITGSDQVWNSKHNLGIDEHYYFAGFPKHVKKIAYAASIGQDAISDEEYNKVKQLLSAYTHISVRENSAKKIIKTMGYNVEHLLDPTFMLSSKEWEKYMSKRIVKSPYILVYAPYDVTDIDLVYKSAREIAKQKNLKVVTFSWNLRRESRADKTILFANPGDFLSLMYYADYVITTSFHGTAFSVNLNKKFCVYFPKGFSTRIKSILELCNLEERIVNSDDIITLEKITKEIDYSYVNNVLAIERNKSIEFLKTALAE